MYVASPARIFVDCVLVSLLSYLLVSSSIAILDKAILFAVSLIVLGVYNFFNIISVTTELFAIAIAMLFFLASQHELFIFLIVCVGVVGTLYVLLVYIPPRYVLALGAIAVVMAYMVLFTVSIVHQLDAYAGSFFMSIVFLGWHGWIQLHPMRNIGE